MQKALAIAYALTSYTLFFGLFLYLVGWLANAFVPVSIDSGPDAPLGIALLVNAGLVLLFGLQHSVMARPGFKRWWTQFVPAIVERPTYIMASNIVLALVIWCWQPMTASVWDFTGTPFEWVGWAAFGFGWGFLLISTFLINHFDLFGLQQVFQYATNREVTSPRFAKRLFYKAVRHPIYLGWTMAMWFTPAMSVGHLVFAAGMTIYMLVAVPFEERDLVELHGDEYRRYQGEVPALVPGLRRGARRTPATDVA